METAISTDIPEEMKEPCAIRDAIGDAMIAAEKRGITPSHLVLTVAKDAYDALTAWQGWVYGYNVTPWEHFVRGYKSGKTRIELNGVKMVPAEWGTGWTLYEKRKGKK